MKNFQIPEYDKAVGYNVNPFENGYNGNYLAEDALPWMVGEMKAQHVVQLGWKPSPKMGHASLAKKIRYLSDFSKYRINIMNPNGGQSSIRSFKK